MSASRQQRIGPWRRRFQWLTTLALLLIPFARLGGESLLRLDLASLTLHAGGRSVPLEELYLVLLAVIALVLLFLLVTLALGRAWCGWGCPQTTLVDLVEGFARLIGVKVSAGTMKARPWQTAALHFFYIALALLVACNLVWYFISPYAFFPRLLAGDLAFGTLATLAITAGLVYLDLAFLRRLLCREFCPYGRFQTVLVDAGTLVLRYHPDEAPRCIRCGACTRVCPTGIDIRRGYQIECINCGRCLDACREVMAKRGQPGIIRYTFGTSGRGLGALLNPRMALVAGACLVATGIFFGAAAQRPLASLKLARAPGAASRQLPDGTTATFFHAVIGNRSPSPQRLSLGGTAPGGAPLEIRGPAQDIVLAPGTRLTIHFAVVTPSPPAGETLPVLFVLRDTEGLPLAEARATITPVQDHRP